MRRRPVIVLGMVLALSGCGAADRGPPEPVAGLEDEPSPVDDGSTTAPEQTTPEPTPEEQTTPEPTPEPTAPATPDQQETAAAGQADDPATDDLSEPRGFEMPSGNIACLAADYGNGPSLRCEMVSGLEPPPADPPCDFDWAGVTMAPTGPAVPMCASDTMRGELPAEPLVLAYGTTWTAGPFSCASEDTGLTCTNGDGGLLFLSRARWEAS